MSAPVRGGLPVQVACSAWKINGERVPDGAIAAMAQLTVRIRRASFEHERTLEAFAGESIRGRRGGLAVGEHGDRQRLEVEAVAEDLLHRLEAEGVVEGRAAAGGDRPLAGEFLEVGDDRLHRTSSPSPVVTA